MDQGWNYKDDRVSLIYRPNSGTKRNEVLIGEYPDMTLNIPAPIVANAQVHIANNRDLPIGKKVVIEVTGVTLVGRFWLRKGTDSILAERVQVKETDAHNAFSDTTEARAHFIIRSDLKPSQGWALTVENETGSSNPVGGFRLVNP